MSLRSQFDEIHDSITNGQRRQAYSQMQGLDAGDMCEMLDYFSKELGNTDLAIDAAKAFICSQSRRWWVWGPEQMPGGKVPAPIASQMGTDWMSANKMLSEEIKRRDAAVAELVRASQAVVDRWDSLKWKEQAHTGEYIARLRTALLGVAPTPLGWGGLPGNGFERK